MKFKQWLINEVGRSALITVAPNLIVPLEQKGGEVTKVGDEEDIKRIAHEGLMTYYNRLDPRGWRYLKNRYNFHVDSIKSNNDVTFKIKILPITPKHGEEELAGPEDEYYQKYHGGKTGKTIYKSPQDAVKEIKDDPKFGYRGIAWEEWQSIQKSGMVQSRGKYNIGQEGYTMFGYTPDTALHYAHNFAPLPYKIGHRRPGVVIAVPRQLLRTHVDDPENIPQSELGLFGPLEKDNIFHAWMLTMNKASQDGYAELKFNWTKSWDDSKYKDSRMGIFVLNPKKLGLGNANLSAGVDYAIRQMF